MSAAQNLSYALVQVLHNFGAVAAVGGSLAAARFPAQYRIPAAIALAGFATQGASGALFGAVSHYYYGRFPDISGVAMLALQIKIACVIAGCALLSASLFATRMSAHRQGLLVTSSLLSMTALVCAALLRWFS